MHGSQSPVGFTTALARLVLLLRYGADSADQREALRALVLASQDATVELVPSGGELLVNGRALPVRAESVAPLLERLIAHDVQRLVVRRGAMAGELADLARILASEPDPDADGAGIGLWNVQLVRGDQGDPTADDAEARALAAALESSDAETVADVLERLEHFVLAAAEAGRSEALVEPLLALDRCAGGRAGDERALRCARSFEALATPAVIRQFAQQLPSRSDRAPLLAVLKRSGDVGAHALIAHLMAAETIEERRCYFDAIVSLRAGIPRLLDALAHPQWYVVRNAVSLLGEMRVLEADSALVPLLDHPHVRVREAAVAALTRLGTDVAREALRNVPRTLRGGAETLADAAASAPLARTLESEADEDVQFGIVAALGRLGTPAAVQRLIAVGSAANGVRRTALRVAALEALATARGSASVPTLRELVRADDDPMVRDAAQRLIAVVAVA